MTDKKLIDGMDSGAVPDKVKKQVLLTASAFALNQNATSVLQKTIRH